MKRNLIGAIVALLSFVSTVHADNVSITPGTGGIGFNPPVTTVPEPNTAVLILIGILILAVLSVGMDLGGLKKKRKRASEHERFADRAVYSNNPKIDAKVKRS